MTAGRKRITNLNTIPYWKSSSFGKKKKFKVHGHFYYRGEVKMAGEEKDICECTNCHRLLPTMAFASSGKLRGDGANYPRKVCRECCYSIERERRELRKNAPPKPEYCDCCHKKTKKLEMDHCHGSIVFRGWLCKTCNSGVGKLGDDLPGVLKAAVYLENDKNKIIETLDKVFNKMFARTG